MDKWAWINIPDIKRKFRAREDETTASISHNGYKNCISERIIKISKDFSDLIIIDKIYPIKTPRSNQKIASYFHFPSNVKLEILNNNIMINSNLVLSVKCENSLLKIIKKSFPISPFYGNLKTSSLIEFVLINNFNDIEPIEICYQFHKFETNSM